MSKNSAHYVSNKDFYAALVEYKKECLEAEEQGLSKPVIPDYIGECILKIANRLSHKANFINYSYREDMVLDGIENCVQCVSSFNPDKSANPFSYFTQVIYFAFLRRISKEKKQSYIKGKIIQDVDFESVWTDEFNGDEEFKNTFVEFMRENQVFDSSFEKKKEPKEKPKETTPLDSIIGQS